MAAPRFLVIKLFGDVKLRRQLMRGARLAGDMRPSLNRIADDMMRVIAINFSSAGRRGGGSWPALDPDTIRYKVGSRPLIETGALLQSWTQRGDENQKLRITKNSIELTSLLEDAPVHEYGSDDVPARPVLRFLPSDRARWATMAATDLKRAITGAA